MFIVKGRLYCTNFPCGKGLPFKSVFEILVFILVETLAIKSYGK